jgi:hypothetical protein
MSELSAVPATKPRSPINAPKILLMGPGGTGKTYALRTLVNAGITPFIVSLDPQGLESVSDIPKDKLHWHSITAKNKTWTSMLAEADKLGGLTYDGITKSFDVNKSSQTRYRQVLETLAKFKCDRTGEDFGMVDAWPTSRAIVIDHFSELCQAGKEWAVGEKLILHEGEWQVAQNNVENLIRQMYQVIHCWVIVLAHIDREVDLVNGGSTKTVHALGKKLAPKLNPLFSDVVLTVRQGKDFFWDSAATDTDLKTRNFPIQAKMPPDFKVALDTWKSRGGIVEAS